MKSRAGPMFPFTLLRFWFVRTLPIWCLCAAGIFFVQIAVCGIVHDNEQIKAFLKFLDVLPPIFRTALGAEGLQVGDTAGLLTIGYQHPLVLFLHLFFAVGAPAALLTGHVQKGTMELILGRTVTKTQVFLCEHARLSRCSGNKFEITS